MPSLRSLLLLAGLFLLTPSAFAGQGPQTPGSPDIGLFLMNDGSVRTINLRTISPAVLAQIRATGRQIDPRTGRPLDGNGVMPGAEFRPSPVRPGVPAPVNTWDGLDPEIRRLWNLEQNWRAATGPLIYSYQAIRIQGSTLTPAQMYDRLREFPLFSDGNVAEARFLRARADVDPRFRHRQFVVFRARSEYPGIVGVLNGLQEFVNSRWVPVEIFYDDATRTITAVTLGDHMVVGVRRWQVIRQDDGSVVVMTEAWEARNGGMNDFAMRTGVPGIMTGRQVMAMVWNRYLQNIGNAFTTGGGRFDWQAGTNGELGLWRELPAGSANPFRPGLRNWQLPWGGGNVPFEEGPRHPGTPIAPGFFGPSWVPPTGTPITTSGLGPGVPGVPGGRPATAVVSGAGDGGWNGGLGADTQVVSAGPSGTPGPATGAGMDRGSTL